MQSQDTIDQDASDDDLMGVSELLQASLADTELVGIPQVRSLSHQFTSKSRVASDIDTILLGPIR